MPRKQAGHTAAPSHVAKSSKNALAPRAVPHTWVGQRLVQTRLLALNRAFRDADCVPVIGLQTPD